MTGYFNFTRFLKTIGLTSTEKLEKLTAIVNRIDKNKSFRLRQNETKELIKSFLKHDKSSTVKELRNLLKDKYPQFKWDTSTITNHLNYLENERIISKQKIGFRHFWSVQ